MPSSSSFIFFRFLNQIEKIENVKNRSPEKKYLKFIHVVLMFNKRF